VVYTRIVEYKALWKVDRQIYLLPVREHGYL
jgi:hypothetical protein